MEYPDSITLMGMDICYLNESVFKPVFDNKFNSIKFYDYSAGGSTPAYIHFENCENCKNYELIKEKKQNQLKYAYCKGCDQTKLTLFSQEVEKKLSQKCKDSRIFEDA